MTREQYEQRKRRLEEQLRAGIQLLESACQAQVRALDLVWMLQAEESGAGVEHAVSSPAAPSPSAPAAQERPLARPQPHGQRTLTARDEIYSSFYRLPETFTRHDVCKMLGHEPDRGTLFRILQEMVGRGYIRVAERGAGQRATVYAKNDPSEVPSHG
jgi:CRP-like cAMP-binding protein